MFHISDHNTVGSNYPTGRVLNDPRKRRIYFIRETLEEFDRVTSSFVDLKDIEECFSEIENKKLDLYNPIIIVDPEEKGRYEYVLKDIVYKSDRERIQNLASLRAQLLEHLQKYPEDITKFPGLKKIRDSFLSINFILKDKDPLPRTVIAYFSDRNYQKIRNTYFTLKHFEEEEVKKNESDKKIR